MMHSVTVCCAATQAVLTSTLRYGVEVIELVQVVGKGNLKIKFLGVWHCTAGLTEDEYSLWTTLVQ